MFKHLFNLEYQRSQAQAFGFYLAYLLLSLVVFVIIGDLLIPSGQSFEADVGQAMALGARLGPLYSIILGALVVWRKNRLREAADVLLIMLAGAIALLFGTLLGLVPVAYLTTRPPLAEPHGN